MSWSENLRVCSFVFNTKGIDDRNSSEKIRNPTVLDVGFCDATTPSLVPGTPTHLVDAINALLGGKGKKAVESLLLFRKSPINAIMKALVQGSSDRIAASAMPARIQEFFKDHTIPTETPMILLVYHEEETMNYLRNMGVDTSAWRLGLRSLLIPDRLEVRLSCWKHRPEMNFRTREETLLLQGDIAMPHTPLTTGSLQIPAVGKIRGPDLPVKIR